MRYLDLWVVRETFPAKSNKTLVSARMVFAACHNAHPAQIHSASAEVKDVAEVTKPHSLVLV